MIDVRLLINIGYPFGVAIYEVSYSWRDLPDDVKAGERDHFEYVYDAIEAELGPGEWLAGPNLDDGVWRGLYTPYRIRKTEWTAAQEFIDETEAVDILRWKMLFLAEYAETEVAQQAAEFAATLDAMRVFFDKQNKARNRPSAPATETPLDEE